jgi:hypothetical protein
LPPVLSVFPNYQFVAHNVWFFEIEIEEQLPVAMAGTNIHSQVHKNQMPGHVAISELAISD